MRFSLVTLATFIACVQAHRSRLSSRLVAGGSRLWARPVRVCQDGRSQPLTSLDDQVEVISQGPVLNFSPVEYATMSNTGTSIVIPLNGTAYFEDGIYNLDFLYLTYSLYAFEDVSEILSLNLQISLDRQSKLFSILANILKRESDVLHNIITNMHGIVQPGTSTNADPLDLSPIADHVSRYPVFTFVDSTACKEGVVRMVSGAPLSVTQASYDRFKTIVEAAPECIRDIRSQDPCRK